MSQYSEDGIVDIEERTKEVGKILNDPTLFPVEFLSWIKRYIEQSGISLPASSIFGGYAPGGGTLKNLAAGIILPFGGPTAPSGALACDGTAYSRTEYGLLYGRIGTSWGPPPDGSSFRVPDLRDRVLIAAGAFTGVGATDGHAYASSQRHGSVHGHSVNQTPHGHGIDAAPSGHYHYLGTVWDNYAEPGAKNATDAATSGGPTGGSGPNVTPGNANITVGPAAVMHDSFAWAGVLAVITTGGQ